MRNMCHHFTRVERETAARICSANAAGTPYKPSPSGDGLHHHDWLPVEFFDVTERIRGLYVAAWWEAVPHIPSNTLTEAERWAEAEALIRTGWSPSTEVLL